MILKTRQAGDPALRTPSKTLSRAQLASPEIQLLIDSMIETLRDHPGIGLAAPQVGENLQIIIVEDLSRYHKKLPKRLLDEQHREPVRLRVLVNPTLKITNKTKASYFEGCLSVPGYRAITDRALAVHVTALDRTGTKIEIDATGWQARILQHETDHLSGKLYIDTMHARSFISEKEFAVHWSDKTAAALRSFFLG